MGSFIVSARKYRPLTFESVVGQRHITETLQGAIKRHQLAHAYLFTGPRGVGKTTCARILAKTINCLSPKSDTEACDKCESCLAFNENRSFNIHELDAASNNSVDNIRSLTEQVRVPPQIGKYSIYIIDEAHMLSTAAFNAFLKTLEEPPVHAIFILATTEKHKILPTILSRCQIYDFKRIKVDYVVKYLQFISKEESISFDDESLHIISQKADGCMRDALSMYDKVVSYCGTTLKSTDVAEALNVLDYDTYFKFTDFVKEGNYSDALVLFDAILQKGFDAMIFLGGLSNHLRNLLVAKNEATLPLLEVTGQIAAHYKEQASTSGVSFIFDSLSIISEGEARIRQSNSQRLHAEIAILKLCNLSPLKLSGGSLNSSYTLPSISGGAAAPVSAAGAPAAAIQAATNAPVAAAPVVVAAVTPSASVAPTAAAATSAAVSSAVSSAVVSQQSVVSEVPMAKKTSRLGISINTTVKDLPVKPLAEEDNLVSEESQNLDRFVGGGIEDEQMALDGCKSYATELLDTRPRLAQAFAHAKVEDGKVAISVVNSILESEILTDKHEILRSLYKYIPVDDLDLVITVDETIQESKSILAKDEDKLKFLAENNSDVLVLCKQMELDYV